MSLLFLLSVLAFVLFLGFAAATADVETPRKANHDPDYDNFPVIAAKHLYAGTLAVMKAGLLQVPVASGQFCCVVTEDADNSLGANSAITARCEWGSIYLFAIPEGSIDLSNIGDVVYAKTNQEVQTTNAASETRVGKIVGVESATEVWVFVEGPTF